MIWFRLRERIFRFCRFGKENSLSMQFETSSGVFTFSLKSCVTNFSTNCCPNVFNCGYPAKGT